MTKNRAASRTKVAWLLVIVAFFILAIQLFITILEFKLTALAGFVLVPFALWNRTSFLAERVLGNVVSSGIKVMVLAVIVGIGSGFFGDFVAMAGNEEADIAQAMSLVLASLSLLGLAIFGPGVASGLVAGAPQLGAGAAVGTTAAAVGTMAVAGGAALSGGRALAGASLSAVRAGTAMSGAVSTAYAQGQEMAGSRSVGAGLSGVASAAAGAARERLGAIGRGGSAPDRSALHAGASASGPADSNAEQAPAWAQRLHAQQTARHHRQMALQTIREGDRGGAGAAPDISEKED